MIGDELSRRVFLARSSAIIGGSWMATLLPDILSTAAYVAERRDAFVFSVLTAEEVLDLEAIADQILPSDETAGAKEAGAVYFMDRAFETFMASALPGLREGLRALNRTVQATHPDVPRFSALTFPDRTAMLKESESTPFFGLLRFLTLVGTFSHPDHGGNRDKIGWRLLGFEDRHVWQPPFGDYEEDER